MLAAHPAPNGPHDAHPALPVPAHPAEVHRGGARRQPRERYLLTPHPTPDTQFLFRFHQASCALELSAHMFSELRKRCPSSIRTFHVGFPGRSVIKDPPANAGDAGLIPGLGRSHERLPQVLSGNESACQCRRKMPWRRDWQPTPVFLPGKSHGQRSLAGYRPRGRKESDMTEQLNDNNNLNISFLSGSSSRRVSSDFRFT